MHHKGMSSCTMDLAVYVKSSSSVYCTWQHISMTTLHLGAAITWQSTAAATLSSAEKAFVVSSPSIWNTLRDPSQYFGVYMQTRVTFIHRDVRITEQSSHHQQQAPLIHLQHTALLTFHCIVLFHINCRERIKTLQYIQSTGTTSVTLPTTIECKQLLTNNNNY